MTDNNKLIVLDTISTLAKCNGRYDHLWHNIRQADPRAIDQWLERFESCKDAVDVVMQLEGC